MLSRALIIFLLLPCLFYSLSCNSIPPNIDYNNCTIIAENSYYAKTAVSSELHVEKSPYSNSLLNQVFKNLEVKAGASQPSNNSNETTVKEKLNSSIGSELEKIRENSSKDAQLLSDNVKLLLYFILPAVGLMALIGLIFMLLRQETIILLKVVSNGIPLKNALVSLSHEEEHYSAETDSNGIVKFELHVKEKESLNAQAFVEFNNLKLASKNYSFEYDPLKEIQETIVFDDTTKVIRNKDV